jgi:hypothetical protein
LAQDLKQTGSLIQGQLVEDHFMPRVGRIVQWVIGVAVSGASAAHGQNLDAGKSPAQIFSETCNVCHQSPRALKQTTAQFMRAHYTTNGRDAAAIAAYLATTGSDPREVQQRRPPTLGAGQAPPTDAKPSQEIDQAIRPPQEIPSSADQAKLSAPQIAVPETTPARRTPAAAAQDKPSEQTKRSLGVVTAAAVKPRRPSESLEANKLPEEAYRGRDAQGAPPQPAPVQPVTQNFYFEE